MIDLTSQRAAPVLAMMGMVRDTFDVVLLLALPASGKSELRRYVDSLDPDRRRRELHLAEPIHLDDYPYVHLMRLISREMDESPVFFASDDAPFEDARDWGTLAELLAEDWATIGSAPPAPPKPGAWVLDRLDRARIRAGARAMFAGLDPDRRCRLESAIADTAAEMASRLGAARPAEPRTDTVIIELARGGPEEGESPLPAPWGYRFSLSLLPRPLLERAVALYVWVTPQQSRLRNRERAREDGESSILHHGVPEVVMRADYGTDDMAWLLRTARRPGTISIPAAGGCVDVPAVAFDNRDDLTSFLRDDPALWDPGALERLHLRLVGALERLWAIAAAGR